MTKALRQEPKKDPDPHEEFHEVDDLWFQIFGQLLANRNTRVVRVLRPEDLVESRSRSHFRGAKSPWNSEGYESGGHCHL